MQKKTFLHNAIEFGALGVESLENDMFSAGFRSNKQYDNYHILITILSIFIRFFILLPLKLIIFIVCFILCAFVFTISNYLKITWLSNLLFFAFMKLFKFVLGIRSRNFGRKIKSKKPHIYVCNHTSFLDFLVLSSYKFHHAVISENHGGMFGFLFKYIISKNGSICFKRSDKKDKNTVKIRIQKHLKNGQAPMIIFPEGTCVNNNYSVLFQKGAFEFGVDVYPVALKYKKVLMDPYWNRKKHGFIQHILYLITRWRIDVDVFWMPETSIAKGECASDFSHRVKSMISEKAKLINTPWNGYFKSQLIHAEHDLFKLAVKKVFVRICSISNNEKNKSNGNEFNEYLNLYRIHVKKENNKIYFDSMNRNQFYTECCIEFLKFKSLPKTEREIIVEKLGINSCVFNKQKQINICTCKS
ncbi:agpat9 [Ecytonucleospora hepatopenaei]|uniref:Agpat9 n=1 Tax=Ecytonucleospora hepatopenaei TaxID=646526 RepID=A0A1W0E5J0_9MICR|nr:agpat9 [Ecytonucleospora hepatopenaei]